MALPLSIFVLLAFVSARVTQFLVFDSLMGMNPESGSKLSIVIDRFAYWGEIEPPEDKLSGDDRTFWRGKVGDLLTCPFCLGFWISAAIYLSYVSYAEAWQPFPLLIHLAGVFAVAGGQSLINALTR